MSSYAGKRSSIQDLEAKASNPEVAVVGKHTLVEREYAAIVQRRAQTGEVEPSTVHAAASRGVATGSSPLPHGDTIQRAFGHHDVSSIRAHTGAEATESAQAMGAQAYATGDHVVLGGTADLHTVAHEAAHVVQQRSGVQLKGGVGEAGDVHERHADEVADAVVAGRSAEGLLDRMAPGGDRTGGGGAVQRKNLTQHGLGGGLTESGTGVLVNRTKQGKVYTQVVGEAAAGRTEAMAKASEIAAAVGNRTVGKNWTPDSAAFDDDKAETLDPFLFKVTVPFGKQDRLTLTYQHADRWTGYVVSIEDTSNPTTKTGVTMFNGFEGSTRDTDSYSNVHDQDHTGSANISKDTEGTEEHNLDAYTKISGEGARWQCVRVHAANLQNDSLFFTASSDKEKVHAVTFVDLWLNWVGAFTARYDIPDADVVKAMKGEIKGKGKGRNPPGAPLVGLIKVVDRKDLKVKDYDLDTHQSHQVK